MFHSETAQKIVLPKTETYECNFIFLFLGDLGRPRNKLPEWRGQDDLVSGPGHPNLLHHGRSLPLGLYGLHPRTHRDQAQQGREISGPQRQQRQNEAGGEAGRMPDEEKAAHQSLGADDHSTFRQVQNVQE